MPDPVAKETKWWKKTLLLGFSFGAGLAIFLSIAAGSFLWYESHPKPPESAKPWNSKAVTAEFDFLDIVGDESNIAFYYTLQNNTETDYQLPEDPQVMARLKDEKSLTAAKDMIKKVDSVFIPQKQRARYVIIFNGSYPEKKKADYVNEEKAAFRNRLKQYLNKHADDLDGFVVFDNANRYEIDFPKGWY
jgi:hypothetical protein